MASCWGRLSVCLISGYSDWKIPVFFNWVALPFIYDVIEQNIKSPEYQFCFFQKYDFGSVTPSGLQLAQV